MSNNKHLEAFIKSPIIIAISLLKSIIDIIIEFIKYLKQANNTAPNMDNATTYISHFDLWDFIIKLITATLLWIVIRAYFNLRDSFNDKMKVFETISFVRNKRLFIKSFDMVKFYRIPGETEESYYNRIPEYGLFDKLCSEEYEIVKNELISTMKDKKLSEIDKLLADFYPINIK